MAATPAATPDDPYRVMVVDDSAVIRGLLTRFLEAEPDIKVVQTSSDGQLAINALGRYDIELVVLDIEMPNMDGLTALPLLLEKDPALQILMASTLTRHNAEISLKALQMGAADYVPKPTSRSEIHGSDEFKRELVEKVRALGAARRAGRPATAVTQRGPAPKPDEPRRAFRAETARPGAPAPRPAPSSAAAAPAAAKKPPGVFTLRPAGRTKPQVLTIGSSTGGPQALFDVLGSIKDQLQIPVVITQHMPATFTAILAEHLARVTGWPVKEGAPGDVVAGRKIFVAPGDHHMLVEDKGGEKRLKITQDPPENFCRPAVDPMFRSIAAAYGGAVLGVVLTGMGSDGAKGAGVLTEAGGTVIAQDEASSVVWGMPGATAQSGVCAAVLPIAEIGPWVLKFTGGRA